MKSKKELNALKKEIETLNSKLAELTEEELAQVTGGAVVRRVDVQGRQVAAVVVEVAQIAGVNVEAALTGAVGTAQCAPASQIKDR